MGKASELKLNSQYEIPSPHKRRKLELGLKLSQHKSRIPVRYSKTDHLNKLKRQVVRKEDDISNLNREVMTLRTQKHHCELESFDLQELQANLKGDLNLIVEQIEEIKQYEDQSLKDLDSKYDLATRKLKLEQDEEIEEEKLKVTKEVEELINSILTEMINKRNALAEECKELEQLIVSSESATDAALEELRVSSSAKQAEMKKKLEDKTISLNSDLKKLDNEIEQQLKLNDEMKNIKVKEAKENVDKLQQEYDFIKKEFEGKSEEIDALNNQVVATEQKLEQMETAITDKTNEINSKLERIMKMKEILADNEHKRRTLHNKLQELKGNIRVYCRIRPPSASAVDQTLTDIVYPKSDDDVNENMNQQVTISKETVSNDYSQSQNSVKRNSYDFQFDKVFNPTHTNEHIFQELSQMVQSALDGFNVCVFAYGQTGSGKTWTMSHPQSGMIPLTINKIFNDIHDLKQTGWVYLVTGQFLELYNESIIDLLTANPGDAKYEIKHDDINGRTTITNLSSIELKSSEQAISLFEKSASNRSTASTKSNERSSRSHSIFIMNIKGKNLKTGQESEGFLNLIDLAGSERLNNSQVKGDRLKETQYINKSLSCLGDVIYSLGQTSKSSTNHIPYRNSKLTYLLKHSLGGSSKTLMFVNISPLASNFGESLNSFRFATKVGNTKQGTIIKR